MQKNQSQSAEQTAADNLAALLAQQAAREAKKADLLNDLAKFLQPGS